MKLAILDQATKSLFTNCGLSLTPAQEHIAATASASGLDWKQVLKNLSLLALKNLPTIISLILGTMANQQNSSKTSTPGCCDHRACASDCFNSALATVQVCANHCCECCCE